MQNGLSKIWASEKSIFCLIVILITAIVSIILHSVSPIVASVSIVAPIWTFVKGQINKQAITSGLEKGMQNDTPSP